ARGGGMAAVVGIDAARLRALLDEGTLGWRGARRHFHPRPTLAPIRTAAALHGVGEVETHRPTEAQVMSGLLNVGVIIAVVAFVFIRPFKAQPLTSEGRKR
ncbi:hypothetical protein ACWD6P_30685, partial [Streptomyces sp. NPDC002446]